MGETKAARRSPGGAEIAAKLTADKRKKPIEDMVDKVQNAVDEGNNFTEAATADQAPVTTTPLVTAAGTSRTDAGLQAAAEFVPALKTGFEIAPNDPPEIVTLPNEQGYALVSPAEVVPAAPAPLASIRDRSATDWINGQAFQRARAAATKIAAGGRKGFRWPRRSRNRASPSADAADDARRIQIAEANGRGRRADADAVLAPQARAGWCRIQGPRLLRGQGQQDHPGNALIQPGLISRMQNELAGRAAQDYAQQFVAAVRADMKVKRNEDAIKAVKTRIIASGG